jgi:hypothetical protein
LIGRLAVDHRRRLADQIGLMITNRHSVVLEAVRPHPAPEPALHKATIPWISQSSTTTAAERRAMLEEADQLTRDDPQK